MRTVYRVIDMLSGKIYYRTSIAAILEDHQIPLKLSPRHFSTLAKEKGFPLIHSNCHIEKVIAWSVSKVRKNNELIALQKLQLERVKK